jgi:NADP-dependent 3-hydroxy acid dehydrogenase YdfG
MKIAITGHTSGIGKAFYNRCKEQSFPRHEPIGFSRSNEYDINDPGPLVNAAKHSDVFVNNAHDKFAQVDLLYALWKEWKDKEKQIVCISSLRPDYNADRVLPYSVEKCALDHTCEQLQMISSPCRIINIKPGFVDTPRVADRDVVHKMDPDYIARIIMWSIEQPEYLMTLRIAPYPDPGSSV